MIFKGHIDVGDGCWRPNVLVPSLRCWWSIQDVGDRHIEKTTNITKKVANIMILSPTSEISHHHKVTNITMSPTSLSPFFIEKVQWTDPAFFCGNPVHLQNELLCSRFESLELYFEKQNVITLVWSWPTKNIFTKISQNIYKKC